MRIPLWVDAWAVRAWLNETAVPMQWFGCYLTLGSVAPGDVVTIDFPMVESTSKHTVGDVTSTCRFRGNTCVEISPRPEAEGFPFCLDRSRYEADRASMKTATRYVSPVMIDT